MLTRSYRDPNSPFEQAATARAQQMDNRAPKYSSLEIGDTAKLTFPEPPTFNAMIKLAGQRTREGPKGERLKRVVPLYWVQQQRYKALACAQLDASGWRPPPVVWRKVSIVRAQFHLHQQRDPVELLAGLKWPIDLLVDREFLVDDSPTHLTIETVPEQVINRAQRVVHLWIRRDA